MPFVNVMQVPVFLQGFGSHWLSTLERVVVVVAMVVVVVLEGTLAGQLFGRKKPSGQ